MIVGSESVSAMIRNRLARMKLAPFTMSHTKCEEVEALPPLPHTKIRRFSSRATANMAIAWFTFPKSMVSMAFRTSAL